MEELSELLSDVRVLPSDDAGQWVFISGAHVSGGQSLLLLLFCLSNIETS